MHKHHDCDHEVKYCARCDVAYCTKCAKEWSAKSVWVNPYTWKPYTTPAYPNTFPNVTCQGTSEPHNHQ